MRKLLICLIVMFYCLLKINLIYATCNEFHCDSLCTLSALPSTSSAIIYVDNISICNNHKSIVTSGSAITLDTCISVPDIKCVYVIEREQDDNNCYSDYHIQTILNQTLEVPDETISLRLFNIADSNDVREVLAKIHWNIEDVDITKKGTYLITGNIILPPDKIIVLTMEELVSIMQIDVKDPSVPDIGFVSYTDSSNRYFQSDFPTYIENSNDIILWKSENNKDWYDYTDNCEFVSGKKMIVHNVELGVPCYFKLEVKGNGMVNGVSNTIKMVLYDDNRYVVTTLKESKLTYVRDGGDRYGCYAPDYSSNADDNDNKEVNEIETESKKETENRNVIVSTIDTIKRADSFVYGLCELLDSCISYTANAYTEPPAPEKSSEINEQCGIETEYIGSVDYKLSDKVESSSENCRNRFQIEEDVKLSSKVKIDEKPLRASLSPKTDNSIIQPIASQNSIDVDNYEHDFAFLVIVTISLFLGVSYCIPVIIRKFKS